MQTFTKYIIILVLSFYVSSIAAQDSIPKSKATSIESLKESIKSEEREALKIEVEEINKRVLDKEITYKEAETLKEHAAKKRALNIQNRIIILENKIALRERNDADFNLENNEKRVKFGITIGTDDNFTGVSYSKSRKSEPIKYDIKTTNDLVMAFGLNNAIIDGQSLGDSPYKIGGSGFVELGWNWKTRLGNSVNSPRLKYGFMFQWNKYELKDNKILVQNGNTTSLETFSSKLKQSEFRNTNLVFPLYFEFGPMKKVEKKDRVRYINNNKFKFGIGAYGGFNLGSQLKLRYKEDGERVKQKIRQDFNVNTIIYGLGAYVGVGDLSLYAKYDLSETFKNQTIKQNNFSLGVRVDLD